MSDDVSFKAYVLWGESVEPGTRPTLYEFDTKAERDAFLKGVDEGNGWMDYTARTPDGDNSCPVTNDEGEECTRTVGHDAACQFPTDDDDNCEDKEDGEVGL